MGNISGVTSRGFFYLFHAILILQIGFAPTVLLAADSGEVPLHAKERSVFLPDALKLPAKDFLKSSDHFNENEKAFIEKYFNEPARVTLDLMILARALSEKADQILDVNNKIKSRNSIDEVAVEIPGLGKAEFNSFGYKEQGKIFTRFVHYQTGTSYIFIDTDIMPLNELTEEEIAKLAKGAKDEERARRQLRAEVDRYTALQQMHTKVQPNEYTPFPDLSQIDAESAKAYLEELVKNAKENPPKKTYDTNQKIETGRLVKIIGYSGKRQVVNAIREFQRYTEVSPLARVAIYWRSIKQGTRLNWEYYDHGNIFQKAGTLISGDALISLFSTAAQTTVFALLKGTTDPFSLILVSGWAFAFSITPTARNWINVNSSKSAVLFKSFLNSVAFNYILLTAIHGADVVFALNATALNLAFLSLSNAMINNFGKVWWYKVPQMRQRAGLNLREVDIGKFRTRVDQSSFEQQAWYLGSNIFRTADLIAMGTLFTVIGLEFTASRVAMLLSIPTMHYFILKYAERKDSKERNVLRQEWDRANYLHWKGEPVKVGGYKVPIFYMGAVPMFAKEVGIVATNSFKMVYWVGKVSFDLFKNAAQATLNAVAPIKPGNPIGQKLVVNRIGPSCSRLFQ